MLWGYVLPVLVVDLWEAGTVANPVITSGELDYHASGTWTGYASYNAGDPLGAGTGDQVPLAGYIQTGANYVGTQSSGNTLVMDAGHEALFLDDSISPGYNGGARLVNIDTIKLGATGDQLVDLTSNQYSLNVTSIVGGKGNEIILNSSGNTTIDTGSGNDYVWTGNGNDTIIGGHGTNTYVLGKGNDVVHGGSGFDTVDFSKLSGVITIDIGNHTAILTDPTTGAVLATDAIYSIEKVIGTSAGMNLDTGNGVGLVGVGGAGNDSFHVEGTSDVLSGGGGNNSYDWTRKFVSAQQVTGGATEITDFQVGKDVLNLSDFLKGQGIKHAQYSDVVQLVDTAQGTLVDVLAGGKWHELAMLDHVHNASVDSLVHHMPLV